ncbi:MAG: polyphosphate:AMP phosphotransferase [Rhodospirillaceae bacterium]|nr:polyphosphate:AMP phosphotransferase [Rhodospirillaceae bacterium]
MFKAAETGTKLSDAAFRAARDQLRFDLVELQQRCRQVAGFPIIIVLAGVQGAGVVDSLNLLNTWMDPRWIHTHAIDRPSDEERERPLFWRYWRSLPAAGNIGLYLDGWYGEAFAKKGGAPHLRDIKAFERTLTDDGALIVKIWLHLTAAQQKRKPDTHQLDPVFGFRASDATWPQPAPYGAFVATAAKALKATHTDAAPWHVINGHDDNHRRATLLTILRDAMENHRKAWRTKAKAAAKEIRQAVKAHKKRKGVTSLAGPLSKVDLSKTMSAAAYAKAFRPRQDRLYDLQKQAHAAGVSTVIAFEGWDAAGKGGAIRRVTYALSARNYEVVPIAAPNDEERAHHYLWRFWRHLGRAGHMTLFDRTWYGRVLVERVDRFITDGAWKRAYKEINEFEKQLADHGTLLVKFWLHIDAGEQLKRFKERRDTPYKRWKLTDDDWHNRGKRALYEAAVNEMLTRTSTTHAPWHVVPANDKQCARIMILDVTIKALERALKQRKSR